MDIKIICSQCGNSFAEKPRKKRYIRTDLKSELSPIFCSSKCAHVYDSTHLTLSKLCGLAQWFKFKK